MEAAPSYYDKADRAVLAPRLQEVVTCAPLYQIAVEGCRAQHDVPHSVSGEDDLSGDFSVNKSAGNDSLPTEAGVCSIDGHRVSIYTFSSDEDLEDWLAVAEQVSGVAVGDRWSIATGSEELAAEAAAALDGREAGS